METKPKLKTKNKILDIAKKKNIKLSEKDVHVLSVIAEGYIDILKKFYK